MVRLIPIKDPVTIVIDRSTRAHGQADEIDRAWQGLCAQNPRYFNGQILVFDSYDPTKDVIRASVEEYKHHAVRDWVDTGISLLAVTAILIAPDPAEKTDLYLLGKRSDELHRNQGLWELGPAGGIDVPPLGETLNPDQILDEITREIEEEIGIKINRRPSGIRALVHDHEVGSTDIAISIVLDQIPNLNANWEYSDTRWVTLDELYRWTRTNPEELITTTVEIARFLYESRD